MRQAAGGLRSRIPLILIFSLALFLRLFRLGLDGLGSLYYAGGVQSMLAGWHNFLFASFDPAGFVSLDKPPLGFRVQALSVRLLGFHGWALILPQALAAALPILGGPPVMAMGGFTGVDPILTPGQPEEMVTSREVRFLLVYHSTSTADGTVGWVSSHCTPLDWASVPADMDLYDCAPR